MSNRTAYLRDAEVNARAARLLTALLLHARHIPEPLLREALLAIVEHAARAEATAEALAELADHAR